MPRFRLTTPFGTEEDVSSQRIVEALRTADRSEDAEDFAVVTRDDGVFVQLMAGGVLEVGGTGDLPHRLDHAELARAIVERLAAHQEPWGDLPHWDVAAVRQEQSEAQGGGRLYLALAILTIGLAIAAVIWWT